MAANFAELPELPGECAERDRDTFMMSAQCRLDPNSGNIAAPQYLTQWATFGLIQCNKPRRNSQHYLIHPARYALCKMSGFCWRASGLPEKAQRAGPFTPDEFAKAENDQHKAQRRRGSHDGIAGRKARRDEPVVKQRQRGRSGDGGDAPVSVETLINWPTSMPNLLDWPDSAAEFAPCCTA
jgi:hypothetical protein